MSYDMLMRRMARTEPINSGLARRSFLKLAATSGFALGAFAIISASEEVVVPPMTPISQPSAFIRVGKDNSITVLVNRLDFGQGVATTLPMLVAEELDADWRNVRGELAPAGAAYSDPFYRMQITGGSTGTAHSWQQYRELGARARAMFVAAAAQRFGVAASSVKLANGVCSAGSKRATLGELADDAQKQPVPEKVTLKEPATFKLIGKPMKQISGPAKSSGKQIFGLDIYPPGVKSVLIARPPVFGARVASFDASQSVKIAGVVKALQVLLDSGATGVAIVADGYWPAKQARDALEVQWDTSGVDKADTDKLLEQYRALAKTPGLKARIADTSKIATARHRITAEYVFPYLAHAPMEPLNCVIDCGDHGCKLWMGSQIQTLDQATVATVLGLKPEQVELFTMMSGGGFGRRAPFTSQTAFEAAQVAKAWKAAGQSGPLKIVWSREDDIRGGYYRPMHVHRAELGFDGQGRILGWQHRIVGQSILMGTLFESFQVKDGIDGLTIEGISDTQYEVPLALEVHHPKVNVPVLAWRSVGNTHSAFVVETLVDEVARMTMQDPVEYRRKLLGKDKVRNRAALNLAVEKSGYGKRQLPKGQAFGVAMHESFGSVVAYVVEAALEGNEPRLVRVTAGVHCNKAVNPLNVEAQIQGAALMSLGTTLPGAAITLKDGVVEQSNFGEYIVARMPQMPEMAIHIVPSEDPPSGIGEPGLPPLAPAYANAIARLTGKPVRELPFKLA
jgi:isoquinoline 1-oxidoreductase beta subunit